MMRRKLIIALLTLALAFPCAIVSQKRMDAMRESAFDQELLYLPNERLLDGFTAGMSSVVADLLWLQCIQYTAEQFRGDFKFVWLDHMLKTITRLDPYFTDVYQWGGVLLAMLKHDDDASINLLKSGIPYNPTSWQLPFEIARTYVLNRRDEVNGARYMAMAAATGNPPQFVVDWAKNLQKRHNMYDVERGMWLDIIEHSGDESMRSTAQRRLTEVDLRQLCDALTEAVKGYASQTGTMPSSLQQVVDAGAVDKLPEDPLGGTFLVTQKGEVLSTSVLETEKEARVRLLDGWIEKFRKKEGRPPAKLDDLITSGITHGLPVNPFPGAQWEYDPSTGAVK